MDADQHGTGRLLVIDSEWNERRRGPSVSAPGDTVTRDHLSFSVTIPGGGHWATTIVATPTIDDELIVSGFPAHLQLHDPRAAKRFRA